MKNNTFIFGDSGFIGTHLAKYLSSKKKINLVKININQKIKNFPKVIIEISGLKKLSILQTL